MAETTSSQWSVAHGGRGASRRGRRRPLRPLAFFALILFLFVPPAFGEEPAGRSLFKIYGPDQGLTDPSLCCLAQDTRGFIWIGTENGLIRYDGSLFRKWTSADGLPSSWIQGIFPTPEGGLWLATTEGLVHFLDGTVTPARFAPDGKTPNPNYTLVDMDRKGRLTVLRRDAVYRQSGAFTFDPVPGRPPGPSECLACSPVTGATYVAIGNQIWELTEDGSWSPAGRPVLRPDENVDAMAVDGTGRLWILGVRSLFFRDPGGGIRDAAEILPGTPFSDGSMRRSAGGWVGVPTNDGLLMVRGDKHRIANRAAGLPSNWARAGGLDREGNLWVVGPRLYRRLGGDWVRGFTQDDGLPTDLVWIVRRDDAGRLFAGTNDGVAVLGERGWRAIGGTKALAASAIAPDGRGNVWFAFSNGPVGVLERGADSLTQEPFQRLRWIGPPREDPRKWTEEHPYALLCDRSGTMWVGDAGMGIFAADLTAGTLSQAYGPREAKVSQLIVLTFAEDPRGRLWAATNEGLVRRDAAGWHRWSAVEGLGHAYVEGVLPLADGTAWVWYQESGGLDRVRAEPGSLEIVEHLGADSGLRSDRVFAVVEDGSGGFWIALDHGLDHMADGRVQHLGRASGLIGEDCCANGMWCSPDGDLWVGTATGLAHVRRDGEAPPPRIPQCFITKAVVGKRDFDMPLPPLGPIPYEDATVEFWFSSPTFARESEMIYEIRLAGFEEEWRASGFRAARYARLPGGDYRFEVRARYPEGPPGPVASVIFRVESAWWRTWWSMALMGLAVACAGMAAGLWRSRALERQKLRLEALVEERTADLQQAKEDLEVSNAALERRSLTDPLTGLHNRRFLSMVIEPAAARAIRLGQARGGAPEPRNQDLLFFMVDIDRFKAVNDTWGHQAGDEVLRKTAACLLDNARSGDTAIRLGGDEFLLLAHDVNGSDGPPLAERIRQAVAAQALPAADGPEIRWTCSIGFAALPFHPLHADWLDWEEVLALADACLYAAKSAGRDAWVGAMAGPGLDPQVHGGRLPGDFLGLSREGLLTVVSSRPLDQGPPGTGGA